MLNSNSSAALANKKPRDIARGLLRFGGSED